MSTQPKRSALSSGLVVGLFVVLMGHAAGTQYLSPRMAACAVE